MLAAYPRDMASHARCRSLDDYLADLLREYAALPMTHRDRGPLVCRIREVEAAIGERRAG